MWRLDAICQCDVPQALPPAAALPRPCLHDAGQSELRTCTTQSNPAEKHEMKNVVSLVRSTPVLPRLNWFEPCASNFQHTWQFWLLKHVCGMNAQMPGCCSARQRLCLQRRSLADAATPAQKATLQRQRPGSAAAIDGSIPGWIGVRRQPEGHAGDQPPW